MSLDPLDGSHKLPSELRVDPTRKNKGSKVPNDIAKEALSGQNIQTDAAIKRDVSSLSIEQGLEDLNSQRFPEELKTKFMKRLDDLANKSEDQPIQKLSRFEGAKQLKKRIVNSGIWKRLETALKREGDKSHIPLQTPTTHEQQTLTPEEIRERIKQFSEYYEKEKAQLFQLAANGQKITKNHINVLSRYAHSIEKLSLRLRDMPIGMFEESTKNVSQSDSDAIIESPNKDELPQPTEWMPRISQEVADAAERLERLGNKQKIKPKLTLSLPYISTAESRNLEDIPSCRHTLRQFSATKLKVDGLAKIVAPEGNLKEKLLEYRDHLDRAETEGGRTLDDLLVTEMDLWWCSICTLQAVDVHNATIRTEINEYQEILDMITFARTKQESLRISLDFVLKLLD